MKKKDRAKNLNERNAIAQDDELIEFLRTNPKGPQARLDDLGEVLLGEELTKRKKPRK